MNEFKFRGMRVDNGEWVYGYYYKQEAPIQCIGSKDKEEEKCFIIYFGFADWNMPRPAYQVEVIPSTIAPYIGKKDKYGKEIYRDDILATSNDNTEFELWNKDRYGNTNVVWDKDNTCFRGSNWTWTQSEENAYSLKFVEVIGNIHEPIK